MKAIVANIKSDKDDVFKAKTSLDSYKFPVMSLVIAPNGTIIHKINANDLLDQSQTESEKFIETIGMIGQLMSGGEDYNPTSQVYARFLQEGVTKAKASI